MQLALLHLQEWQQARGSNHHRPQFPNSLVSFVRRQANFVAYSLTRISTLYVSSEVVFSLKKHLKNNKQENYVFFYIKILMLFKS